MFHTLKAWKDYLNYRKYLMGSQVAVLHFIQSVDTSLLKACFDALKTHKETEKFLFTQTELNEGEKPLIEGL